MKTLFLQFADEGEATAMLTPFIDAGMVVDVIGVISVATGEALDTPDGPVPEMAPLPGWFVNVLGMTLPDELLAFEIFPENPVRVFAVEPVRVPHSCTRRQGLLTLLSYGIRRASIEALIAAMPDEIEREAALSEYEAGTWERSNPFLQQMWSQLGGTPEQLDEVFRVAVTL